MSITSPLPRLKVLVSGAGIAGPCLAYWLARTRLNASITVLERSPVPRPTGQSIDIRGPAIEIIKKMKLDEAVRSRHTTEEGTRIVNASGKTIAEFTVGKGNTFTAEYEILRADLCGLFLEATEKMKDVKYVYGDYVTSLKESDQAVDVGFESGSSETYDLVVGADGSTSKIRTLILDEEARKDSYKFIGQYIAYFSIPRESSDTKHWYWYNAPGGLGLMTRPHRNNVTTGVYMCITTRAHGFRDPAVEEAMEQGPDAQKRMLHEYFESAGWQAQRILAGMDHADDFYMSRAAQVKLPRWHSTRAVLIGDAAFATFGVGTTLAIHAAYVLAGELSKMKNAAGVPEALDRYEKVFRKIYKESEDLPPGFPQIAFPQTAWGMKLRDIGLWFVGKTKAYKLLPSDTGMDIKVRDYDWIDI